MKQSKYIIMGCLSLMLGFSSCEMKDELLGEKGQGTEMGTLEVDLRPLCRLHERRNRSRSCKQYGYRQWRNRWFF